MRTHLLLLGNAIEHDLVAHGRLDVALRPPAWNKTETVSVRVCVRACVVGGLRIQAAARTGSWRGRLRTTRRDVRERVDKRQGGCCGGLWV